MDVWFFHVVDTPTVALTASGLVLAAMVALVVLFVMSRGSSSPRDTPRPTPMQEGWLLVFGGLLLISLLVYGVVLVTVASFFGAATATTFAAAVRDYRIVFVLAVAILVLFLYGVHSALSRRRRDGKRPDSN